MDKKSSLRINNRRETTFGIISLTFGALSLFLFIVDVYLAGYHLDGREVLVGLIALGAMLLALVGTMFGIIGESRLDRFRKTAHLGLILNGSLLFLHGTVIIKGFF